jgi:hypothetical protein
LYAFSGANSMTKKLTTSPRDRGPPPTKWNFFGPAPLLDGEDPAAYDELLARVSGAVKPPTFSRRFGSATSSTSSGTRCACVG